MKFNYKEARKERDAALSNRTGWNLNILTHVLFLASVACSPVDDQLTEPNCDLTNLDVVLTVNGIEIDLEKGLSRIVGMLNDYAEKKNTMDEILFEFKNKLNEL